MKKVNKLTKVGRLGSGGDISISIIWWEVE